MQLPVSRIVGNCLNIITITIPPALPLSLSIGLSIAFTRLSKHGIFCIRCVGPSPSKAQITTGTPTGPVTAAARFAVEEKTSAHRVHVFLLHRAHCVCTFLCFKLCECSPPRIINAGRVNTLCFDKTGTLTRDGLTMRGVLPLSLAPAQAQRQAPAPVVFGNFADDMPKLYAAGAAAQGASDAMGTPQSPPPQLSLSQVLAACHSLSVLHPPGPSPPFPELQLHEGSGPRSSGGQRIGDGGFLGLGWGLGGGLRRQTSSYERTRAGGGSSISPEWEGRGGGAEDEGAEEEDEDDASFVGIDGRFSTFVGDPLEVQMFRASGESLFGSRCS